jgi:hypothetical protein
MVMLHASVHLWQEIYLSGRLLDTLLPAPSLPLGWPRQWPRQHWRLLLKEQCLIFIAGSTEKVSSQAVRYSAMRSALLVTNSLFHLFMATISGWFSYLWLTYSPWQFGSEATNLEPPAGKLVFCAPSVPWVMLLVSKERMSCYWPVSWWPGSRTCSAIHCCTVINRWCLGLSCIDPLVSYNLDLSLYVLHGAICSSPRAPMLYLWKWWLVIL